MFETVEIDGRKMLVKIVGPMLDEQFFEDVTEADRDATAVTQVSDEEIWVEPAYDATTWLRAELEQLDDHDDWTIVNVDRGPHGPALRLRYEGFDDGFPSDEPADMLMT